MSDNDKENNERREIKKEIIESKIVEIWENIHKAILDNEFITSQFSVVLKMVKHYYNTAVDPESRHYNYLHQYRHYIQILFAMTLYIRDSVYGLGCRELTYDLLFIWYQIYPVLAISALRLIVCSSYGSWRDIPGLCKRLLMQSGSSSRTGSNFSHTAIELMNQQLRSDWIEFGQTGYCKTNVCKWIPRECCRNSWLFIRLAAEWWGVSVGRLTGFHKKEYRRVFSTLSRAIDVVEIKQCAGQWSQIIPENVTIGSLNKYRHCFLSGSNEHDMNLLHPHSRLDRSLCSKKFAQGVSSHKPRNMTIFSDFKYFMPKRIYFDFSTHVVDAIRYIKRHSLNDPDKEEKDSFSINTRWNCCIDTHRMKNYGLGAFLPVICYNGQPSDKAFLNILGHAYLIACHSTLGKRILFAGHQPVWINLEDDVGFVDGIKKILSHIQCGVGTDLNAALLFLETQGIVKDFEYIFLGYDFDKDSGFISDIKDFFNISTILGQARYYHEWD